jgi:hypothetical protein
MILGGAALRRCGNCTVFNTAFFHLTPVAFFP